jgi:hypothetical protein
MSIKPASFTILFYLISSLSFSQSLASSATSNVNLPKEKTLILSEDEKWSSISLSLNAAGFLVSGPIVQVDFRIAKKTYIGAYYINHYMGLFAGTMIFDSDITDFSPKSMGGGINLKHYFKANEKQNAWYFGIYLGYSYNEATYHSGLPNEKVEMVKDLLLFGSGGYRLNFGKHFYGLAGLQLGAAYTYDDKIYSTYILNEQTGNYIKEETLFDDYQSDIYPYILPEITIGINF